MCDQDGCPHCTYTMLMLPREREEVWNRWLPPPHKYLIDAGELYDGGEEVVGG